VWPYGFQVEAALLGKRQDLVVRRLVIGDQAIGESLDLWRVAPLLG
jgi:hypothetical protein